MNSTWPSFEFPFIDLMQTELKLIKMMKTNFLRFFSTMTLIVFVFTSCDREDRLSQGSEQEEEQVIESASTGEDASDDALEIAAQAEIQVTATGGRLNTDMCATITHDLENKKVIIDFGDGCVGPYGRERKGKIIVTYSSEIGDSIANRIITFEDYFVNNKGITGTIELRDVSINVSGNLQSVKKLVDLTISFPNGERVVFNGTRTREWISGAGDADHTNNIYRITGSINGESTTGRSFTHEIVEPIIADWSCAAQGNFARIAGVVEMTKLGGYVSRKRTVDYGDGECDNTIVITTFKRTYVVTVAD
ncbi:MAG: hypothetical protein C0490_07070 [Marivirga sp.]|nr:hypothetical protein [Marivirga sp.]